MVDGLRKKGAANLELIPPGARHSCSSSSDPTTPRQSPTRAREQLIERLQARPGRARACGSTRAAEATAVWRLREVGSARRRQRSRARRRGGKGGTMRRWRRRSSAPYLRDLRRLLDEYQYQATYYGHFGHGCIHMQVSFDLQSEPGIRKYAEFVERAADLVVRYGGSISGEHGDGQSRGALLPKMFGPELMTAFREFKAAWDPGEQAEPGQAASTRICRPRICGSARTTNRSTRRRISGFRTMAARWRKASLRCIGLGECRKQDSGAMCPSYMVDARGRAQHARPRAPAVRDAAGRSDSRRLAGRARQGGARPVPVVQGVQVGVSDQRRHRDLPRRVPVALLRASPAAAACLRVRHDRSVGAARLDRAARSRTARQRAGPRTRFARRCCIAPRARAAAVRAGELSPAGAAAVGHDGRGRTRSRATVDGRDVILWVDTFNNYVPSAKRARRRSNVLRAAGFNVMIPQERLCCGRPLYEFGLLDQATQLSPADPRRARSRRSTPAARSSSSSRAARRCFATSCAICSRRCAGRAPAPPDVSAERVPRASCPGYAAAAARRAASCCTGTATTRR